MSSFKIECPKCHKTYTVAETVLGRKVTCATKTCGEIFLASLISRNEPDESIQFVFDSPPIEVADADDSSENVEGFPESPADRFSVSTDQHEPVSRKRGKKDSSCYFGVLARLLFYPGLFLIVVSFFMPCTKYHIGSGSGSFELESGYWFNMRLAMEKLSVGITGMSLLVSGAALWSRAKQSPEFEEVIIVFLVLLVSFAFFVWKINDILSAA